jgi:pSer/pThr/pTyr-binding forkhead associated (FHA) protein
MPLKTKILEGLNQVRQLFERSDLPAEPLDGPPAGGEAQSGGVAQAGHPGTDGATARDPANPPDAAFAGRVAAPEHLGAYGALVAAIRAALERFVATDLRLHLAIAGSDRWLLTAIRVRCVEPGEPSALLQRFGQEFKPEQIKRFLARDVIAGLPHASAIDLSQFAGLAIDEAGPRAEEASVEPYAELLAALRDAPQAADPSTFDVSLDGRWVQVEAGAEAAAAASPPTVRAAVAAAAPTPIAGAALEILLEDATGRRAVVLSPVVPGRRYSVGKDPGCDLVVAGTFASRRHCELWQEGGRWRLSDAGSTNGTRVESAGRAAGRSGGPEDRAGAAASIELPPGAVVVLSAHGEGSPADYPRLSPRIPGTRATPATPVAPRTQAPRTPITPIARSATDAPTAPAADAPAADPARAARPRLSLAVRGSDGARAIELDPVRLPFSIGRSRSRSLVVPATHEGVSGHHLDIVSIDGDAALVEVHGDNGVLVGGRLHAPGARLRWLLGQPMEMGRASPSEPPLVLELGRTG